MMSVQKLVQKNMQKSPIMTYLATLKWKSKRKKRKGQRGKDSSFYIEWEI